MAHLSPKKGGFPFKDHHDRTCPIAYSSINAIERGTAICVDSDTGYFRVATVDDAGKRPIYLSLQDGHDLQSAMAGFFSVAKGDGNLKTTPGSRTRHNEAGHSAANVRAPAITGILLEGDTWQLDTFDETKEGYKQNAYLTLDAYGRFVPTVDATKAVAYCVCDGPYSRYVNDHVPSGMEDLMTGGMTKVIDIQGK